MTVCFVLQYLVLIDVKNQVGKVGKKSQCWVLWISREKKSPVYQTNQSFRSQTDILESSSKRCFCATGEKQLQ